LGFDPLRRALQRAGALQRGEHGELTVAVSVPFLVLGDLFERFRSGHGGATVELVESTSDGSLALFQQRSVDVAFVSRISGAGGWNAVPIMQAAWAELKAASETLPGFEVVAFGQGCCQHCAHLTRRG